MRVLRKSYGAWHKFFFNKPLLDIDIIKNNLISYNATVMMANSNNDWLYWKSAKEKAFLSAKSETWQKKIIIKNLLKTISVEMNGQKVNISLNRASMIFTSLLIIMKLRTRINNKKREYPGPAAPVFSVRHCCSVFLRKTGSLGEFYGL